MNHYSCLISKLEKLLDKEDILLNESMKNHTYFKIGGKADILITPKTTEELISSIKICDDEKTLYYIIGNGSNLLVKDGGFRGVIIKLSKLDKITVDEDKIIALGGAKLKDMSGCALKHNLTGFEFACGIPGSVGGAVTMNAGAYDGEMVNVVTEAVVMDKDCNIITLKNEDLELGYRTSAVMKYNYIVLSVTIKLKKADPLKIKARIDELTYRREDKQPLEYPSAGSTFKRPEGHFAGKLIEDSGLKGTVLGGAAVSEKHSGFIINKKDATAKDILDLIELVQKTVSKNFNVDLHPEVRIIGED
ncbi:UDP-N-acetylmuramate dehydrogenase [Clostridium algidicarnis]|uniref:UDP-N-acetylmuramate dehydrogenase n=1 Tax=Clostridium algidicarnis TaxID=37659 RepID=UPI001C0C3F21|nr:UDP-N-acetylmuramate dehydrogenase [Clostridium algidicarnis]MBU3209354.1 UDP-N-acetylmuramate dehydrogenase [Clostridium algidicarnis]MCB2287303.1 UDP-N-acetylmuramate dehydrogenase [Clostridium algidicarnis]